MFASSSSYPARPSLLHRALRTAVAFATLEAVVLEPGESAAVRGAGSPGAASGRSLIPHPHRTHLEPRLRARRPGAAPAAPQLCLLRGAPPAAPRPAPACRAADPASRS